jgi:hypoxanthine phosphoribosyltransferase
MHSDLKQILLSESQINARVHEMGRQISKDYAGQEVVLVGVLKGAVTFFTDLARAIDVPASFDFISCSSYGSGTSSSGKLKIKKDLDKPVTGKNILVVEDIIDTGITLSCLLPLLKERGARTVKLATLLSKPSRRIVDVPIDYNGFEVPDSFVVGYGLDYAEHYRNLPYIGILKEEVYSK